MYRWMRALVGIVAAVLVSGCATVFFHPLTRERSTTPAMVGLPYEDVYFEASDGVRLHGWFLPAHGEAVATVLFLHGNTGDIGTHLLNVAWLPAERFNVLLFDYRGFGRSAGIPSFAGVFDDIERALAHLAARRDIDRHRIIVYGQSQGGALAIRALAQSHYREHVLGLVVDGAFSSYRRIAEDALGASFLTRRWRGALAQPVVDLYSPRDAIARISPIPILIIHSAEDQVIPLTHARELFAAALAPKELWVVPSGVHNRIFHQPENRGRLLQVAYNWVHDATITAVR